jgi:hypothetical protein
VHRKKFGTYSQKRDEKHVFIAKMQRNANYYITSVKLNHEKLDVEVSEFRQRKFPLIQ